MLTAACAHCRYPASAASSAPQSVTINLVGKLAQATAVHVWHTTENNTFVNKGTLQVKAGAITMEIDAESVYSVTTLATGSRGQPAQVAPPSGLYPLDLLSLPLVWHTTARPLKILTAAPNVWWRAGPFPDTYADNFDAYADESNSKYFADQCGSFQVLPSSTGPVNYNL